MGVKQQHITGTCSTDSPAVQEVFVLFSEKLSYLRRDVTIRASVDKCHAWLINFFKGHVLHSMQMTGRPYCILHTFILNETAGRFFSHQISLTQDMHKKYIPLLVLIFNSGLFLLTLESYITGCMCTEAGDPVTCAQAHHQVEGQQLTALFANWVSLWSRLIRKDIACDWKERESQKSGQGLHIMNIAISVAKSRSKMVNKNINLSTCLQPSTSILAASTTFQRS